MANFLKTVRQLFSSPSPSPNSDVIVIDDDDEGITKNRLSQFLKTGQLSTFLGIFGLRYKEYKKN